MGECVASEEKNYLRRRKLDKKEGKGGKERKIKV